MTRRGLIVTKLAFVNNLAFATNLAFALAGCGNAGLGAARADTDRLADAIMHLDAMNDAAAGIIGAFPQRD